MYLAETTGEKLAFYNHRDSGKDSVIFQNVVSQLSIFQDGITVIYAEFFG